MTSLLYKFVTGRRSIEHLVESYRTGKNETSTVVSTNRANFTTPKISLKDDQLTVDGMDVSVGL